MKNSPETQARRVEVTGDDAPNEASNSENQPNDAASLGGDDGSGLQADLERFRDLALRSQADFDNFKKRAAREKEEAIKYANSSLLERLVAIMDNFELGLTAAKNDNPNSPILAGMGMVLKQLQDFVGDIGLAPIDAEGQPFDPNLHEAIANEPSATVPEGTVVRQMRRGYKLKDRLLRPSTVVVSSGPPA